MKTKEPQLMRNPGQRLDRIIRLRLGRFCRNSNTTYRTMGQYSLSLNTSSVNNCILPVFYFPII